MYVFPETKVLLVVLINPLESIALTSKEIPSPPIT